MGYRFDLEDARFLCSTAGADALAAAGALPLTGESRLRDVRAVRRLVGERFAAAVLETAVLRRRAVSKLDGAGGWLLTDAALQQATPSAVARHRAARLAGRDVHDVTCSIGADVVELAGTARRVVGSDLDPVRLAMAAHNLVAGGAGPGVLLARADALAPVTVGSVVVADPARRDDAGRRRWRVADFVPALDELATVYSGRALAVKAAPGMDFALVPWAAEVELVSLDGDVREACLWSTEVATPGVRRRATVLRSEGPQWTITDAESDDCPVRAPGEWIVNPDGSVVRAGLVRHYAARHGLGQLDPRIAYLTGDTPPPGVRAFRVIEHGHFTEKALRAALRRHDAGAVEILVRGLDVDPDALRRRLRLRGQASLTTVLTRIGNTPTAFVCHAEPCPAR